MRFRRRMTVAALLAVGLAGGAASLEAQDTTRVRQDTARVRTQQQDTGRLRMRPDTGQARLQRDTARLRVQEDTGRMQAPREPALRNPAPAQPAAPVGAQRDPRREQPVDQPRRRMPVRKDT